MIDRIGLQLGNYRLTRLLGQGSFAEVYLGEHPLLGTKVAIKVLHTQVTQDDVAQFKKEARILAGLRHPQIVRILDFGIQRQTPYLIMDYASNGTLRTRHVRGTLLPVLTVVNYVKQIAEALQYAHDCKVVHRDIKPENMLIGEHDEILLSDFGIALIAYSSRYQSLKDMAGTIAYMAPEQIEAHPRQASDQYSLGIVAYEWLCGTLPFHGPYTEIAIKHSVTPPPSPRGHVPTLSPDVEHVVLKALAKQPEERFASVSAFAAALEQASQDMLPTSQSRPIGTSLPSSFLSPPRQLAQSLVIASPNSSVPGSKIQTPSALPDPPEPQEKTDKPSLSRRAVLIGVTSVALITAVGAGVFIISRQQSDVAPPSSTVKPQKSPVTTQTPPATPQNLHYTYTGHTQDVRSVAWSPLGEPRIVSSSGDRTAQVWNANDGSHVYVYHGQNEKVNAVTWSPDGKYIASGAGDKTVQVWDANNGGYVRTYTKHTRYVYTVAWSPNGQYIASGSADGAVHVWNANNGNTLFPYNHSELVRSVAWSPQGDQRIASGSEDKTVQVWNANNKSHIYTYTGHSDQIYGVTWSPDGKRIASGSNDTTVQVWNAKDGSNVYPYRGHSSAVNAVAWSPDGQHIASGSKDKTVQVWNASDGTLVFTYKGHSEAVNAVAWSKDGKWIASGSADMTVQVWSWSPG